MSVATVPAAIEAKIRDAVLEHYAAGEDRGGPFHYREHPADHIGGERKAIASAALALARDTLAIRGVELKWFDRLDFLDEYERSAWKSKNFREWRSSTDTAGVVFGDSPNTIWINADQDRKDLARSIWHECRHVYQNREWGPNKHLNDRERLAEDLRREMDAFAFMWTLEQSLTSGERKD